MSLSVNNFFRYYLFNFNAQELTPKERGIAKVASVALFIITAGITHLFCGIALYDRSFKIMENSDAPKVSKIAKEKLQLNDNEKIKVSKKPVFELPHPDYVIETKTNKQLGRTILDGYKVKDRAMKKTYDGWKLRKVPKGINKAVPSLKKSVKNWKKHFEIPNQEFDSEGFRRFTCYVDVPFEEKQLREAVYNFFLNGRMQEGFGGTVNLDLGRGSLSLYQQAEIQCLREILEYLKNDWGKSASAGSVLQFPLNIASGKWLDEEQLKDVRKGGWSDLKYEVSTFEGLHGVKLDCTEELVSIVLDAAKELPYLRSYNLHRCDSTLLKILSDHLKNRVSNGFPVTEIRIHAKYGTKFASEDIKPLLDVLAKAKGPIKLEIFHFMKYEQATWKFIKEFKKKVTELNTNENIEMYFPVTC